MFDFAFSTMASQLIATTARLLIRELTAEDDAAFLLEVLNDPAFVRNVGDRGVRTEADAAIYIRQRISSAYESFGFSMWRVELRTTGEPIGICGLLKRDSLEDVDIGFAFLEPYRSRGYAFEAASASLEFGWNTAKLPRIVAITAPHNTSSIRLLEKLGFRFERVVRLTAKSPEVMLFAITAPTTAAPGT